LVNPLVHVMHAMSAQVAELAADRDAANVQVDELCHMVRGSGVQRSRRIQRG
jgi:hypothetical protein